MTACQRAAAPASVTRDRGLPASLSGPPRGPGVSAASVSTGTVGRHRSAAAAAAAAAAKFVRRPVRRTAAGPRAHGAEAGAAALPWGTY